MFPPTLLAGLLALLLGMLPCAVARADTVVNLYGAAVPVADRSQAATDEGIVRALGVVLVKLSGQRAVLAGPAGRALLGRAARYVTVFGHEADTTGGYRLRVDFDPRALAAALREHGVVLWGAQRPRTLAWLVIEDPNGRRLAPDPAWPDVARSLAAQAGQRAIPLATAALTDAADLALPAQFATAPPETLLTALAGATQAAPVESAAAASSPVAAPRLAGVLATADGNLWTGRWRIVIEGVATDWENTADTPEALVVDGIDRAADALGAHFANPAVFGGGVARVPLTVDGISSADDYGWVSALLRGLDLVTAVDVVRVGGNAVQFDIAARGGATALAQRLRLMPLLVPAPERPGTYLLVRRAAP